MAQALTGLTAPGATRGGGPHAANAELPGGLRSRMEAGFGADFSTVRIHADSRASGRARESGAEALTQGRDIYFGHGHYRPHTLVGQWLIAHELAHVVQQSGGGAGLSAVPPGRLQRRAESPMRNDADKVFTYPLEVYTVDEKSHAEASEVRDTLNAFEGTILDVATMNEYTVRFRVRVFPPPDPDVLEEALGVRLHYRLGKQRLRKRAYQRAAQRYWIKVLSQQDNRQNLYLGRNKPVAETREYISDAAAANRKARENEITQAFGQRIQAAEKAGQTELAAQLRAEYHQTLAALESGEDAVNDRLDDPDGIQGSLGTTFPGGIVQMRQPIGSPGTEAYQHNVRLHEFMHLLGRMTDPKELEQTVMSYPFLNKRKNSDEILTPQPADIDALVNVENPPP